VLPTSILPEVTYLLQRRIGPMAEEAFIRAIVDGEFTTEPVEDTDLPRIVELMRRYRDFPLGYVDASVVAIAERSMARGILTADRRHFSAVRPHHAPGFTLLP
jgi:predicted nucleic acid-binding protein